MSKNRFLAQLHTLLALFIVGVGVVAILSATGILEMPETVQMRLESLLGSEASSASGIDANSSEGSDGEQTAGKDSSAEMDSTQEEPVLASYTWEDLSEIAHKIAGASDGSAARAIAKEYGLIDEEGQLTQDHAVVRLEDGTELEFELVGVYHDLDTNENPIGLSFLSTTCIGTRAMNYDGVIDGGWEASGLRNYLNNTWYELLPSELKAYIVPALKLTNNRGQIDDPSLVSTTLDYIWVPSAVEVCGEISWYTHEYTAEYSYFDQVANAEGTQYERFAVGGVHCYGAPDGLLVRNLDGKPSAWWYRTPFYFVYELMQERYFYSVLESGYPYGYSAPETELGIVVGFCL